MSAPVVQIEKLDENNYDSWSIQMRSVLIHSGFWKIVNGQTPKAEEAVAKAKWESDDEKALASIFLSVKPTQLGYIRSCTTSHQAWKKLEDTYMPRGPLQKVSLYKKLTNLRMTENSNVVQYLNEFSEIYDKLKETGIEIQEELLAIMLMSSLPKEFDNFVIAMETRDTLPSLSILKQKLLEEGKRRQEKVVEETTTQQAFTAKSSTNKNNKKPGSNNKFKKNFKGKCFICGVTGHFASKCDKRNDNNKTQAMTMLAATHASVLNCKKWYIDSGATSHMCNDRSMFINYQTHNEIILLAGDKHIDAIGKGDVLIRYDNYDIMLENVLYSPELQANFISVSKAVDRGLTVMFDAKKALVRRRDGDIVLSASRRENMFQFDNKQKEGLFSMSNKNDVEWHNRYGHLNFKSLHELSNNSMVEGMKIDGNGVLKCKTCMLSKIHVLPFPQESHTTTSELLEVVHSDVCGPFRVASVAGSKYFVTFIDDKSRRVFVYFIKQKSEVFEKFKMFKAQVERQTGCKIKSMRTDNGGEFVNAEFNSYLEKEGIRRQLTVPHTPQQNGVAERGNRTLVEMARSMMVHAGVRQSLWAEAINTAVYIRNRCPTRKLQNMTPYEVWCGRKPSVKHLRTFGACAVALDKSGGKSKFEAKGKQFIMVGYSTTAKAYRLYDTKKNKVFEHRDVLFDDDYFVKRDDVIADESSNSASDYMLICCEKQEDAINDVHNKVIENEEVFQTIAKEDDEVLDNSNNAHDDSFDTADDEETGSNSDNEAKVPIILPGRPKTIRSGKPGRPKKQYNELFAAIDENLPQTVEEAFSREDGDEWRGAMEAEFSALQNNKTWSLVDLPKGHRAIPCRWVYAIKRNVDGEVERYKARLVAKGCHQRFGIDFHETFSPVVRYSTIRILLALAVKEKMYLHQLDVSTAYLNSDLHDEIYMQQPQNFKDSRFPNKVMRLHKAIYGLKQSGREWNSNLDGTLRKLNFVPCDNESCLYKGNYNGKLVLIAVYVDDIIVGCIDKSIVLNIKAKIAKEFNVDDKGELRYFLGMEIERDGPTGTIKLSQSQYIRDILEQYGMENCKTLSVPLEAGYQVSCDDSCEKVGTTEYQSLVGTLMYLAISTRPDILHSVSKMAQRNADPRKEHFTKLKHILRYLAGTKDLKLIYQNNHVNLEGYVDADWGGNTVDRKSYTGFVFSFGGCPITWESRKQTSVALSSTEAEYVAASEAAKEAIYLKRLLNEINAWKDGPVILHIDNQGAKKLAENPVYHKRSKHIDIRFHHIRDLVHKQEIRLEHCPTANMVADVMTKNLSKTKHYTLMKLMNLK